MKTKKVLISTILLLIANCLLPALASAQQLYGMTRFGGTNNDGVLFQFNLLDSAYTKELNFTGATNGQWPIGSLMQASNGNLYGMSDLGGANDEGVLFQFNPATAIYTKGLDFNGTNGAYPHGSLMQASDGNLYGMTIQGGANGDGVLFKFNVLDSIYTKELDFAGATNGSEPWGSLIQASDGNLYGMTSEGGANGDGVLFKFNFIDSIYTKMLDFGGAINGENPQGSLIQASDGNLYGMTLFGGATNNGVIFKFNLIDSTYTDLFDFTGTNGSEPRGALVQASDGNLYGMTEAGGTNNLGVIFKFNLLDSSYIDEFDFTGTSGYEAYGSLMQASDGNLYGLTDNGGANNDGVLFQFNLLDSTYSIMFDFNGANGQNPNYTTLIEIVATINTSSVSVNNCAGSGLSVPYAIAGTYNAGNLFTAQLSNASGSFASPVNIGADTTTTPGIINAAIPSNTPAGTGYRIRVVSSDPIDTGSDNGINIVINATPIPTITASGATTFCYGYNVMLSASIAGSYLWSNGDTTQSITVFIAGSYSVIATDSGCSGTSTATIVTVNSTPPVPTITGHNDTLYCSTNLSYISYQWYSDTTLISEATDTFLVITQNGNYNVEVTNANGCVVSAGINANIIYPGINEFSANDFVSLFPNPATEQLSIHASSSFTNDVVTVSLMNMLGQDASPSTALRLRGEDAVIDISMLPAGIYFLAMKSESGNATKRFVKE